MARGVQVRNSELSEEAKVGFPCELYNAGTHEELRAGQPIYYPTPGSVGIGPLDLYHSLDSLVGVGDVLRSVINELAMVHRLQAGASLTALKTVVLQQALIEWRLLLEEEDLTEELSKKGGDEISRRPYANNFLVDDPFAMDKIIDVVQQHIESEAEEAAAKKTPAKKKGGGGGGAGKAAEEAREAEQAAPRLVFNEVMHPQAEVQAHMNAIEAVLLRRRLLDTIYESEVLQVAYRAQAAAFNRDMRPEPPTPIEFIHPSDVESGGRSKQVPLEEVSSLGADFATRLAVLDFDLQFANFDFQTDKGLVEMLHEKNFFLRKALRSQVLERGMLAIALEYNQAPLDRCMESVILKEDGLMGSGARALTTGGAGGAKKKHDAADVAERNAKIAAEVKKFQMEEANRIGDLFLDLRSLKKGRRESILERFNQKSATLGQGRQAAPHLKSLKCQLLDLYCDQMLSEVEVFSVKGMIGRTADMLARQLLLLPKPKLLFTQSPDPQATREFTQARALEESDDQGRDTSIFSADLSVSSTLNPKP